MSTSTNINTHLWPPREFCKKWASSHAPSKRWRMPALAGPRFALTLAALPALALGFSLRPGPPIPHLPTLRHRHELLNMIAPAPPPKPIDRLLNPLRRQVYTLLKPVSAHAARTVHAHACHSGCCPPPHRPARRPVGHPGDYGDVRRHSVPGALVAGPGASWPVQGVRQGGRGAVSFGARMGRARRACTHDGTP